ncbi:MAG: PDZ domain-containing protein [Planctomycetes bacterium]|nr:PDZ domain-containing protein [Planctomycetota bacterium]
MNHLHALFLLTPVLGLSLQPTSQQPNAQQPEPPGLIRIQPLQAEREPFSADAWRSKLSSADLDRREQDFAALAQRLRLDPIARAEVEQWAREGDGELAWTARLLLREAEGRGRGGLGGPHSLWLQMPDGLSGGFGGLDSGFGGLDLWMQDLEPLLGRDPLLGVPGTPPLGLGPGAQGGASSQAQSFQLRSGPDGVHVTTVEEHDGNREEKEYTAESMDELLEQHPELRDKLGPNALLGSPDRSSAPGLQLRLGDRAAAAPTLRTDVLGVTVRPLPKHEAKAMGLDEGLGLVVERVEAHSLAAALGIQRGHVLVGMNGHELRAAQDITDQLCARQADGEIRVELIDRWGQRRARTWKPEAESAPAPKPSVSEPGLRKI